MKNRKLKLLLAGTAAVMLFFNPLTLFAAQDAGEQMNTTQEQITGQQGTQPQERGEGVYGQAETGDITESREEAVNTVEAATRVWKDIMDDPSQSIPPSELQNAAAVAIVPDLVKAGLIAGGRHGTGVLIARNQNEWSPPVFISVSGASLGAQVGVESTDLILVFKNKKNLQEMTTDSDWTIGVDASVAAGPAGAKAKVSSIDAEVLSYKRTQGLFAGVSLTGAVLTLDEEPTIAYYDLTSQTMRGYFGEDDNATIARKILGMEQGQQQGQQQFVENVPPSAGELKNALQQSISQNMQQGGQMQDKTN